MIVDDKRDHKNYNNYSNVLCLKGYFFYLTSDWEGIIMMDIVLCQDCTYFKASIRDGGSSSANYSCGNTMGLLNPKPNEYCSRACRAKESDGVTLDQSTLDALLAQRRK